MRSLPRVPGLAVAQPFAPGRFRMRAQIAAAALARTVGEASRLRAVAALRRERLEDSKYRQQAAAIFPVRRPLLNGRPWVGAVGDLVAAESRDAQFSLAQGTIASYAPFIRRAMTWMQAQWALQLTGRPFSVGVAAAHPELVLAYLRHLADTSPAKQLAPQVKQ